VGGSYLDSWKFNTGPHGNPWVLLNNRLHNSIDNYATGHTRWSVAAIQAYMSRVQEFAPEAVAEQWQRVWRVWRMQEIASAKGTDEEREALNAAVGTEMKNLVPSEVV